MTTANDTSPDVQALPLPAVPSSPLARTLAVPGTGPLDVAPASAEPGLFGWAGPVMVLLALIAVALWARRRRQTSTQHLQILETTAVGPKRSLVVVRMGNEVLLIGSSEAGLALLASRPTSEAAAAAVPDPRATPLPLTDIVATASAPIQPSYFAAAPARPIESDSFQSLLDESVEDQELRQKLARGLQGRVA